MEDQGREPGFGTLLKHYRIAAGLSQDALAQRARMSADGISALERGHRRTPQRETLALLAGALALSDEQRLNFEAAAVRRSTPRLGGSVSVGPWPDVGEAGVPLSLTSFFGRENELAEISTLVRERRLVTITGAGGVGKTQTALRVANALADEITVRCVEFDQLAIHRSSFRRSPQRSAYKKFPPAHCSGPSPLIFETGRCCWFLTTASTSSAKL